MATRGDVTSSVPCGGETSGPVLSRWPPSAGRGCLRWEGRAGFTGAPAAASTFHHDPSTARAWAPLPPPLSSCSWDRAKEPLLSLAAALLQTGPKNPRSPRRLPGGWRFPSSTPRFGSAGNGFSVIVGLASRQFLTRSSARSSEGPRNSWGLGLAWVAAGGSGARGGGGKEGRAVQP